MDPGIDLISYSFWAGVLEGGDRARRGRFALPCKYIVSPHCQTGNGTATQVRQHMIHMLKDDQIGIVIPVATQMSLPLVCLPSV